MSDLKFKEHTKEKLEEINYYYKTWFKIVKRQKSYIIDAYAGTGYDYIGSEKVLGSALLAVDLFKTDILKNLKIILIQINTDEYDLLERNVLDFISKNNLNISPSKDIRIHKKDWVLVIDDIIDNTKDGICLFLLDPYGNKSIPWNKLKVLVSQGKNEFGYKESGIELLINWSWHATRRLIGKYFKDRLNHTKEERKELENLDNFFGSIKWKQIVNKYDPIIFDVRNDKQIRKLGDELVLEYVKPFFEFFRYICIHPIYARVKTKEKGIKRRGKIVYYLIFTSNYIDAPKIIGKKFKEYINKKYYLPKSQGDLSKFLGKTTPIKSPTKRITINDKIKNLQNELKAKLSSNSIAILKFLYRRRSQDYGCFDFALYNEFNIDEFDPELKFLLNNNILKERKRRFKSGGVGKYYYLFHRKLVNRNDYLYFKEKVFLFKNGKYIEVQID
ncbi:hypothetical protein ES705_27866 [subsurface metagenome]